MPAPDSTPIRRWRRPLPTALGTLGFTAVYALLERAGLVDGAPLPAFAAIAVGAALTVGTCVALRDHVADRVRWFHATLAAGALAATAVFYATGWGPALVVVGYFVVFAEVGRATGSRAFTVGIAYALGGIALGQLAVELGWAPSEIDEPAVAHALAALGSMGLVYVGFQVAAATRHTEHSAATLGRYLSRLEATNSELDEAQRVNTELVATVSHELRSPLAAVVGFADTLADRWDQFGDAEKVEFAQALQRQARRMHRTVDDLLVLSKLLRGRMDPVASEVPLAAAAVDALESAGVDDGVEIEVPSGLAVWVDPDHLHRILENLLSNAHKYGEPPVVVTAEHRGHDVVVHVRDHGPGVPESFEASLFEKFAQARDAAATRQGLGLGLAIVRSLVGANGGTVRYQAADPGADFVVELPRAVPDRAGDGGPPPRSPHSAPLTSVRA